MLLASLPVGPWSEDVRCGLLGSERASGTVRDSPMPTVEAADQRLSTDLLLLESDHLLMLRLDRVEHLLSEPEVDPFVPRRGLDRSGIDDAALTLRAARRLPDDLTVRVGLPTGTTPSIPTDQAQTALRRVAADQSNVDWRGARAVRSMGRRQLPMGITIALLALVRRMLGRGRRGGNRVDRCQGAIHHVGRARLHGCLDGELDGCRGRHLRLA